MKTDMARKENCLDEYVKTSIKTTTYIDAQGIERCHYSGQYTVDNKDMTVTQYFECDPYCVLITLDEACSLIGKLEDERLIKPFIEIAEERYNEMLECLPPQKWQTVDEVNIFRMSEYETSNITGHYVSYNGKFYSANRRTSTAYAEIAKEIKAI